MSIKDLMEQFEIQGAYHIKFYNDNTDVYVTLAKGDDFRYDEVADEVLERKVMWMYVEDGKLVMEVDAE